MDCVVCSSAVRIAPCVAALALAACDPNEADPRLPASRDWPARPRIVEPSLEAAPVLGPDVAAPSLAPSRLIPPIVRGPRQVDTFLQDEAIVDILWVVDNSASVSNERARLAQQFDRFLNVLLAAGVDFHVGVTSTDLSRSTGDGGRLRGPVPFIDRNTPDPRSAFRQAVTFPVNLDVRLEEGLAAMVAALTPPNTQGPNRGFLRDEASLAVIVVTDEDDGSIGLVEYYGRFLRGLKGPGREANISFSVVGGPLPDGCIPAGEELIFGADADAAERYSRLVDLSNGLFESICALDFAPFVEQLATRLSGLRLVFPLSVPPVEATIEVRVDGRVVPMSATNGWTYSSVERAIIFHGNRIPPPRSEVVIDYDVAL